MFLCETSVKLAVKIMKEILLKYNQPVPRYTSYPPANYFKAGFTLENHIRLLEESNTSGESNISIYLHTPFCKQKCHFCGCNSLIWNNDQQTEEYIQALLTEIKNTFKYLDTKNRKISQIHWGGGTPNNLSLDQHKRVLDTIRELAQLLPSAEIAIECNPAYLDESYIIGLSKLGFNRISIGIQDFDLTVLKAINREPSALPLSTIMDIIRKNDFKGVNLDFVYGLPLQTIEGFKESIAKAISLKPDRIVTFSYAHMPSLLLGQANIQKETLPSDDEKLDMYLEARKLLIEAGYEVIGFDHFALPNDELTQAKNKKSLHRNFQGYCTRETTGQVYAFGSSGITQLGNAFIQNVKSTQDYIKAINTKGFATWKGYELNEYELICSKIIEEIMCNGFINLEEIAIDRNIEMSDLYKITGFSPDKLLHFINDKLVVIKQNAICVSETGMMVVRNIAMLFDPLIQNNSDVHSKTI